MPMKKSTFTAIAATLAMSFAAQTVAAQEQIKVTVLSGYIPSKIDWDNLKSGICGHSAFCTDGITHIDR